MDHRGTRRWRLLRIGTALAVVGAVVTVIAPAPAWADDADHVTVTGIGLAEPLEVPADEHPDLCAALYREVAWLVGTDGDAGEPDPDALGPQFTLVAEIDGEPRHRFHLYPLAQGGPRVFRPAEQPGDRTADEGWFHGRVSLPETLVSAGVPVHDDPNETNGAGGGEPAADEPDQPDRGLLSFLEDWREGMQLTLAVTVGLVVALAGVAFLIRRKV